MVSATSRSSSVGNAAAGPLRRSAGLGPPCSVRVLIPLEHGAIPPEHQVRGVCYARILHAARAEVYLSPHRRCCPRRQVTIERSSREGRTYYTKLMVRCWRSRRGSELPAHAADGLNVRRAFSND